MADRLINILNFQNVGPGVTVGLAHGLNIAGRPIVPDRLDIQNPAFTYISCTATTVTVRNDSGAVASTFVEVVRRHSIVRALGNVNVLNLTPQPFVMSAGGGAGGGASACLIFRPGSGSSGPVVFDTWAALIVELDAQRAANGGGCYSIMFDDSLAACTIPAGAYDMTDTEWVGRAPSGGTPLVQWVQVEILEGATFTGLRTFRQNLLVNFEGATPPISDFADGDQVILRDNVWLFTFNTGAPIFDLTGLAGAEIVVFVMDDSAMLGDGNDPVLIADVATSQVFLSMGVESVVLPDALDVAAGVLLGILYRASSSRVDAQATVLGTASSTTTARERWISRAAISGGTIVVDGDDALGRLYRCNPDSADCGVTLPASTPLNEGQVVTVKRIDTAAVNNANVIPTGTDQIDSGGAGVAFINSIPLSSNTFVSNGAGGWDVI